MVVLIILVTVLGIALIAVAAMWWTERSRRRAVEAHFAPVNSVLQEVELRRGEVQAAESERRKALAAVQAIREQIGEERRAAETAAAAQRDRSRAEIERLERAAAAARDRLRAVEEDLECIEHGIYRPHFEFDSSDRYRVALKNCNERQRAMLKDGEAVVGGEGLSVGGDSKAGQRLAKQYRKLLLRAFNGEADAVLAKVTWSNYRVMRERIEKAFGSINDLGTVLTIRITEAYRDLRLEELRLTFEEAEKKEAEREEQRRIRAQMREEEKVQRELERARREAEERERLAEEALERAKLQVSRAVGEERDSLQRRIAELEAGLAEAHNQKERAVAQAQLTRAGHVYVISNIGSFGENVFKIGMTRRLEPQERIDELGDASVPFPFDVHAMIYSADAPGLEYALHDHFWERRVNRANDRKEFFRVTIDEIAEYVAGHGLVTQISKLAAAKEWRLSAHTDERSGHAPPPDSVGAEDD